MNALVVPEAASVRFDVPADVYHARRLDEASASGMKQLLRSPAHFKYWAENPDDDRESPALTFGRAFHCATLEPDVFDRTYCVVPGDAPRYPTRAQWEAKGKRSPDSQAAVDWWIGFEADNAGRERLSLADYDRCRRMADGVRAHPVAAGLLVGGQREATFRWRDEETGIACKSRADLYLPGEYVMDLKTCLDASPEGFARAVTRYAYPLQLAHYLSGVRACGDAIRWFVFVACESAPPYVCQPYMLDVRAEELGWNLRAKAMRVHAECLRTDEWPGYSTTLRELALPSYAYFGETE